MFVKFLIPICCFTVACYSDTVQRPRGVSLSMVSLYAVDKYFTCFDGSATIPYERINDDYCDCLNDGSDEPGTAACPNGSFYCNNVGHKPSFIPSSRVNDGICDCCDGSDEYTTDTRCENNCYELGQAAREEEARIVAIIKEGSKIKNELSLKGKQLKRDKQHKLMELTKEQSEAEILKNEKEGIKNEIEAKEKEALDAYKQLEEQKRKLREEEERLKNEKEALKAFNEADENSDGILDAAEVSKLPILDTNKDGIVSEEETKAILTSESQVPFEHFLSTGWEYMKQMTYLKNMELERKEHEPEQDIEKEETAEEPQEPRGDNEEDDEENDDIPEDAEPHADDAESIHEEEPKQEYDEETSRIINEANDARTGFDDAVRNLKDIQREIKQIEESLGKDYGKEDEFAYLVGECYEYTDREYTYKLCPFDEVSQRPKDGGAETRLGSWNSWVDDKYEAMFYSGGQSCWNGPQRQAHVRLTCSTTTEVVGASEPSRCEYLLEFYTPAACLMKDIRETIIDQHDEL